jgi:hypothetical protein
MATITLQCGYFDVDLTEGNLLQQLGDIVHLATISSVGTQIGTVANRKLAAFKGGHLSGTLVASKWILFLDRRIQQSDCRQALR